ncbi:zinc-dependent metalloprotease [Snuella lapsa]|uniref:Zinc-dependent metalloprotease n=1 Tax=Snuella lapsa TaxID=870481 RepID=A0ABP6XXV4_9FLAO
MMAIKRIPQSTWYELKAVDLTFNSVLLFSVIVLLATCSLWGQVGQLPTHGLRAPHNFIKAHLEDGKLYFELNKSLLGKDLLFVRHNAGYKQVAFTQYKDQIFLETPRIESLTGVMISVNNDPTIEKAIIGMFPVIAEKSTENSVYIDVTNLFLKSHIPWYAGLNETLLPNVSAIEEVQYLENELIIKARYFLSGKAGYLEKLVNYSFLMLPEPMSPRLWDHRMGYFIDEELSPINYFPKSARGSIERWRLEKKHKDKKTSDPVKPITFYLDTNIPNKWKPYIKAGILEWLPAFEAAGFKNAIKVEEWPRGETNRQSVGYSVVRWTNKEGIRGEDTDGGSTVSKIVDLRSGEILKCDIIIKSSYERLSDDYFIRCSPLDKRAQQYPFPDDLLGELIQYVVAHEAGHAFGLRDANYGEYTYPFEKMRDKQWLRDMGHTPSIMTYARHNYLVQPEDGVPPALLVQKLGPTDIYNIKWGYEPFPGISTPRDEGPNLEKMVREQDAVPWYRYNIGQYEKIGPDCSNNVADNNDPIKSAELGLLNMERVIALLPVVTKAQIDNVLLERLYNKTVILWYEQMQHVMSLIGGYSTHYKSGDQKGPVYTPIPMDTQEEAMAFLCANAFNVPDWLTYPSFSSRIKYSTSEDKVLSYQLKLLSEVLEPLRLKRIAHTMLASGEEDTVKGLLSMLRLGLWSELTQKDINIGYRRQELQSAYIAFLTGAISKQKNYASPTPTDKYYVISDYAKSVFISEVMALRKDIVNTGSSVKDGITFAHLKRCLQHIDSILKESN